jgi:hypothetical protein
MIEIQTLPKRFGHFTAGDGMSFLAAQPRLSA